MVRDSQLKLEMIFNEILKKNQMPPNPGGKLNLFSSRIFFSSTSGSANERQASLPFSDKHNRLHETTENESI